MKKKLILVLMVMSFIGFVSVAKAGMFGSSSSFSRNPNKFCPRACNKIKHTLWTGKMHKNGMCICRKK